MKPRSVAALARAHRSDGGKTRRDWSAWGLRQGRPRRRAGLRRVNRASEVPQVANRGWLLLLAVDLRAAAVCPKPKSDFDD